MPIVPERLAERHASRQSLHAQFWCLEATSAASLDGKAWRAGGDSPPTPLLAPSGLSRPQQLLAAQAVGILAVPGWHGQAGGLVLDRVVASAGGRSWWTTVTARLRTQRAFGEVQREARRRRRERRAATAGEAESGGGGGGYGGGGAAAPGAGGGGDGAPRGGAGRDDSPGLARSSSPTRAEAHARTASLLRERADEATAPLRVPGTRPPPSRGPPHPPSILEPLGDPRHYALSWRAHARPVRTLKLDAEIQAEEMGPLLERAGSWGVGARRALRGLAGARRSGVPGPDGDPSPSAPTTASHASPPGSAAGPHRDAPPHPATSARASGVLRTFGHELRLAAARGVPARPRPEVDWRAGWGEEASGAGQRGRPPPPERAEGPERRGDPPPPPRPPTLASLDLCSRPREDGIQYRLGVVRVAGGGATPARAAVRAAVALEGESLLWRKGGEALGAAGAGGPSLPPLLSLPSRAAPPEPAIATWQGPGQAAPWPWAGPAAPGTGAGAGAAGAEAAPPAGPPAGAGATRAAALAPAPPPTLTSLSLPLGPADPAELLSASPRPPGPPPCSRGIEAAVRAVRRATEALSAARRQLRAASGPRDHLADPETAPPGLLAALVPPSPRPAPALPPLPPRRPAPRLHPARRSLFLPAPHLKLDAAIGCLADVPLAVVPGSEESALGPWFLPVSRLRRRSRRGAGGLSSPDGRSASPRAAPRVLLVRGLDGLGALARGLRSPSRAGTPSFHTPASGSSPTRPGTPARAVFPPGGDGEGDARGDRGGPPSSPSASPPKPHGGSGHGLGPAPAARRPAAADAPPPHPPLVPRDVVNLLRGWIRGADGWDASPVEDPGLRVFAAACLSGSTGRFARRFADYTAFSLRADVGLVPGGDEGGPNAASPSRLAAEDAPAPPIPGLLPTPTHCLTASLTQHVAGPVRARADLRLGVVPGRVSPPWHGTLRGAAAAVLGARADLREAVLGLDAVLPGSGGAARLVAWYSPTRREGMLELRMF